MFSPELIAQLTAIRKAQREKFVADATAALLAAPELPYGVRDMREHRVHIPEFCRLDTVAEAIGVACVRKTYESGLWDMPHGPTIVLVNATPEQEAAFIAGDVVSGLLECGNYRGVVRGRVW